MRSVAALIPNLPAEMWAIVETVVAVVKVQTAGAAGAKYGSLAIPAAHMNSPSGAPTLTE